MNTSCYLLPTAVRLLTLSICSLLVSTDASEIKATSSQAIKNIVLVPESLSSRNFSKRIRTFSPSSADLQNFAEMMPCWGYKQMQEA